MPGRLEGVRYRRARPDDMLACGRVFARAAPALSGNTPRTLRIKPSDMVKIFSHIRQTDPGGFHVAEVDGRVVGYASVIARGWTDFLTQFFLNPSLKGRGVGRPVLRRAFEGVRSGAVGVRCVYASVDPRAQHLYLSFGMVPRSLIYFYNGKTGKRAPTPRRPVTLEPACAPGDPRPEALALAARYDRSLRGARRDADIGFMVRARKATLFRAMDGRREVGYLVVAPSGQVGPGGTATERHAEGLLHAGLRAAERMGAKELNTLLTGLNGGAVRAAMAAGLRNRMPGAWMSAREVMANERYVAGSGILW